MRTRQSCNQCHASKVKCDRGQPSCSRCIRLQIRCIQPSKESDRVAAAQLPFREYSRAARSEGRSSLGIAQGPAQGSYPNFYDVSPNDHYRSLNATARNLLDRRRLLTAYSVPRDRPPPTAPFPNHRGSSSQLTMTGSAASELNSTPTSLLDAPPSLQSSTSYYHSFPVAEYFPISRPSPPTRAQPLPSPLPPSPGMFKQHRILYYLDAGQTSCSSDPVVLNRVDRPFHLGPLPPPRHLSAAENRRAVVSTASTSDNDSPTMFRNHLQPHESRPPSPILPDAFSRSGIGDFVRRPYSTNFDNHTSFSSRTVPNHTYTENYYRH